MRRSLYGAFCPALQQMQFGMDGEVTFTVVEGVDSNTSWELWHGGISVP